MKESSYLEGQEHIIRRIKVLPIFKQYTEEQLKDLLRLSKIHQYQTNEVLIKEGSHEKSIFFMLSGSVQIEKDGNIIAKLKKSGDIFGEIGFLDEGPRSSTVRATSETICLLVDVSYLLNLQEKGRDSFHAAIYKMFAEVLAHRLRETTKNLSDLQIEYDRIKRAL
ncbi:MAG TPA: cyclic nucleotide-binding domain-containing protein [Nitrospinota bacterium]|jgi:CRP-like cAMP-binding protein|nr:cyclic nucleotide-binding domain-containing protein [Nitrospinota bacterium]